MSLFGRRDETLNEKLLREAGHAPDGSPTEGQRETNAAGDGVEFLLDDAELPGSAYDFVTLADGSTVVDEDAPDISDIADAVEQDLAPPYRASAVKQDDGYWLVTARPITVEEFAFEGDEADVSSTGGVTTFTIDGVETDSSRVPPRLLEIGEATGTDYVLRAKRIDGDLWEVSA